MYIQLNNQDNIPCTYYGISSLNEQADMQVISFEFANLSQAMTVLSPLATQPILDIKIFDDNHSILEQFNNIYGQIVELREVIENNFYFCRMQIKIISTIKEE